MMEKSYLAQLRQSNHEHKTNVARLPKLNDFVLVHDNSSRLSWKLYRVVELLSSDDICRAAVIKMCGTGQLLKRAIKCLYPLEEGTTDEHKTASTEDSVAVSPTEADKEPIFERGRAAAKIARQILKGRLKRTASKFKSMDVSSVHFTVSDFKSVEIFRVYVTVSEFKSVDIFRVHFTVSEFKSMDISRVHFTVSEFKSVNVSRAHLTVSKFQSTLYSYRVQEYGHFQS